MLKRISYGIRYFNSLRSKVLCSLI
ncbi:hypothetical protein M3184_16460 [Metabacillus litoralis]|nr:hypothetical protein [Metabacillus litoralis]